MDTALAGPQPTASPPHSTFPASDLELVVDRLTFPLCAVVSLLCMLSLKVLNVAFPHADPPILGAPFPQPRHSALLPRDSGSAPGRGLQRARRGC